MSSQYHTAQVRPFAGVSREMGVEISREAVTVKRYPFGIRSQKTCLSAVVQETADPR